MRNLQKIKNYQDRKCDVKERLNQRLYVERILGSAKFIHVCVCVCVCVCSVHLHDINVIL